MQRRISIIDKTSPSETDLLFFDRGPVRGFYFLIEQLERTHKAGSRAAAQSRGELPIKPELIAVQIPAVMVIEAVGMALLYGHIYGHIAVLLAEKEYILILEHDRIGGAADRRRPLLCEEVLLAFLLYLRKANEPERLRRARLHEWPRQQ